jgi:imidazolonepropionase-like amidohydrolase
MKHFTGVLSIAVVASCSHAQPAPQAPDLVIVGGKVFTSDTTLQWAEAIAIQGERITAVGTSAEVRRLAGPGTRIIDVGGRVVVPGLNDAHEHLTGGSPGATIAMGGEITNPSGAQVLDSLRAAWSCDGLATAGRPVATVTGRSGCHPCSCTRPGQS